MKEHPSGMLQLFPEAQVIAAMNTMQPLQTMFSKNTWSYVRMQTDDDKMLGRKGKVPEYVQA